MTLISFNTIELVVHDVYLEKGDIIITSKHSRKSIVLRKFQEELVRTLGNDENTRYVGLEAPTGGGKTFALLAPLISNILFDARYEGVVGVYPTKPLVNDQFVSIRNILNTLGERKKELKGKDGFEVAIKYALELEIVDRKSNIKHSISLSVGLIRLTKDALDKLQESLKEISGRMSLLNLIKSTFLDADYLIVIAVPEYPYLMLSFLYRSVPDAQKILSLAAEEGFVYDLAKKIAHASIDELNTIIWDLKKEISQLFQLKEKERERFNIYSALFSEILFLDEFHTWTMYERPTVLALILLHYLESLRTPDPERCKIIFSSATPQNEFYTLLEKLGLGSIKIIRAKLLHNETNADRVKSRTIVKFIPIPVKPSAGPISWFKMEDYLPIIVGELAQDIVFRGRAIVFGRRNAIVESSAEVFHKETNEVPAVITGVKTRFLGKEVLEERKESGKLFVFGNYSIELGVDLRKIPYGIVYGVYVGEVIQRFGRIGRGDVDQAEVIIPVPIGYAGNILHFISKNGKEVSYEEFTKLLSEILPERLGMESYGTKYIMKHKIGKLRIYLPLATYILTLLMLWEYTIEFKRLCQKFVNLVESLEIPKVFPWLRKISKTSRVLLPLASFRITAFIQYVRDNIEDFASLSTLLGNYDVIYRNGRLEIKGVSKKSLKDVMTLYCRYSPNGLYDIVISSGLLMKILGRNIMGNEVLRKILKEKEVPLYIAPIDEDYEIFNAFGYAIRVNILAGGKVFYMLLL